MEARLREARLVNFGTSDKTRRELLMVVEMSLEGAAETANLASARKADLTPALMIIAIMRNLVKNSNENRKLKNQHNNNQCHSIKPYTSYDV